MSYRFCFGASGSGKSRMLHNMILEQAQNALSGQDRSGSNYVIIVPDQYSMQTQKEIVSESPQKGILNIDVLSFGRLTHKIFEETGVSHRAVLDDMGKTLLLRRVAGQCEPELKILKNVSQRVSCIFQSRYDSHPFRGVYLINQIVHCQKSGVYLLKTFVFNIKPLIQQYDERRTQGVQQEVARGAP